MSAPADRAVARCACTNIALMQLFHELKQKFPTAPDHAVSAAISAYCHDKRACERHLEGHAAASLAHAYHASSSAAARKLKDLSAGLAPLECRNRLLEQRHFPAATTVRALANDQPQNAKLSSSVSLDDNSNIELVEAVDNVHIEAKDDEIVMGNCETVEIAPQVSEGSPITINIDNCVEKSEETASDVETEDPRANTDVENDAASRTNDSTDSGYRILKSNKIKSNLNEKLERAKEKKLTSKNTAKVIVDEEITNLEKPKRPCTLEFIKSQPEIDVNIKPSSEPQPQEPCGALSPAETTRKEQAAPASYWAEQGYPLNLSVNVNCHMDIANRPHIFYPNPWIEEYESPRAFTSVNLTVCTPKSGGMPTPPGESEGRGFEGHVTVTVSPSTARAPRRHAPPPPQHPPQPFAAPSTLGQTATMPESSLIARQLARKRLLVEELGRERERLSRVEQELAVLAAPLPPAAAARRLHDQVEWLRDQCRQMTRQLDMQNTSQQMDPSDFYSSVYAGPPGGPRASPTPNRPAPPPPDDTPSWQCQICTFSNHGLLNKCEQCEMPRILLVRPGDEITVHLMPGSGRRKIVRSWVL